MLALTEFASLNENPGVKQKVSLENHKTSKRQSSNKNVDISLFLQLIYSLGQSYMTFPVTASKLTDSSTHAKQTSINEEIMLIRMYGKSQEN